MNINVNQNILQFMSTIRVVFANVWHCCGSPTVGEIDYTQLVSSFTIFSLKRLSSKVWKK